MNEKDRRRFAKFELAVSLGFLLSCVGIYLLIEMFLKGSQFSQVLWSLYPLMFVGLFFFVVAIIIIVYEKREVSFEGR